MAQPNDEAITHLTALAERLDDAELPGERTFGQRSISAIVDKEHKYA